MYEHHLQVLSESILKLGTFGPFIPHLIVVWGISSQIFKFGSIFPNCHAPLLQTQEFHFLLGPHICRKVLLQKSIFESCPIDNLLLMHHLAASEFPPVFSLLSKHIGRICDLLLLSAHKCSKDPFQLLDPVICSIGCKASFELWGLTTTEVIQTPILSRSLS
ncbi:hypothetical protein Lalb_Chr05g0227721 [Lupinus albus]|uniref:Uncharacterized protein n=1 Tax=Lupinus albus TaxID=3870 RepID=A0A6A4QKB2_LUPAL|nr:hypothetical protein Lalb_Chr05g0227721 [Lupinus albus]